MTAIDPAVIAAAQTAQAKWRIPASISLAQFGLESGWGKHDLGCFNYFGMKAPHDANGNPIQPFVIFRTREVDKFGRAYFIDAAFHKFASPAEAFDLHAKLLAQSPYYAKARAALPSVEAFAAALTGVYATDPHYGATLIAIIHGSNLTQYDTPQ